MARMFGTDGVRGIANQELDAALAFNLGRAGAFLLTNGRHKPVIIVGRDPRASGDMLASALMGGICAVGAHAIDVGVVTTPAIALLIRHYNADAGVMITASHNPAEHNGIKFFDHEGYKLLDELEDRIEALVKEPHGLPAPIGAQIGRIKRSDSAARDYIDILKQKMPVDLRGLTIVVDCANGAASAIAPALFLELGARVHAIHCTPDGANINDGCGSTHPESLQKAVLEHGADVGLAFDGDADRIIAVDENGELVDGDHIMVICATALKKQGLLRKDTVVSTVMSNLGFGIALAKEGIKVISTNVGDRYVLEEMRNGGYNFGGENSGHMIFLDLNSTGDGLMVAMYLLSVVKAAGKPISALAAQMQTFPQVLVNVRVTEDGKARFAGDETIQAALAQAKAQLQDEGRILVRPSGTEPLLRIMIEGKELAQIEQMAGGLAELVKARLG